MNEVRREIVLTMDIKLQSSYNMELLEEYQELIERDAIEISYFCKYVQMFLYLLCAISGYICSVLFYTLWQHGFGGDCILWAKFILMPKMESDDIFHIHGYKSNYTDWWKYVVIDSEFLHKCKIYLATCFLSCLFGIVWFTFFLICGKGGYNMAIYESPWRIVLPAVLFNFTFATISSYANYNFQEGLKEFNKNIRNVFLEIHDSPVVSQDISECEIIQTYVEVYNFHNHDMCNILLWLQLSSGIMMWSWIGGLTLLLLRIVIISDFKILKVTIYKLSPSNVPDIVNPDKTTTANINTEENKKKQ